MTGPLDNVRNRGSSSGLSGESGSSGESGEGGSRSESVSFDENAPRYRTNIIVITERLVGDRYYSMNSHSEVLECNQQHTLNNLYQFFHDQIQNDCSTKREMIAKMEQTQAQTQTTRDRDKVSA